MKKKKLVSVILATLIALDIVGFTFAMTYHLSACDHSNASVALDELSAPTGEFSEDIVIIPPSYNAGDEGHVIQFPMHKDYTENWLYIPRRRAKMIYGDNVEMAPMVCENMFPGDVTTKTYKITVSHQYAVDLKMTAENIRLLPEGDTTPLSDVLMLRVTVNGTVQYDALLKDFTELTVRYSKSGSVRNDVTEYTIDVYLPTSVGNDYMQNSLMCDFVWVLYEDDYALGTDIIPIPPDDWPWPYPDETTQPEETEEVPDVSGDIEVDAPEESIEEFEAFTYVPAPCYITEITAILAIILVALTAAFVAVRRKEQNDEK